MRLKICQLSFILLFSSCDSTPEDITAGCVGSDVNIPWEYPDSAGMSTVFWEYIDSSNAATTILAQAAGSAAMVQNGYNIQHNTNGAVTILNATVANNGTYRISVAYSSATQPYTDDVVVNVYDPPTDFSFTGTPSGSQTTFTCTASSLGDPADDLYIQVNGVDMTSSVSATVPKTDTVKCILSGSSVQCMNGVSGTVTSLCVQCPKTPGKYVCFWCKKLDKRWKCCFFFFLLILAIVLLIGIIIGIGVEAKYPLWGRLNQRRRILSFFPFFFGFGLFLCDLIRQRCGANEPGGNDPTNKSSDDIPLNKNQSPVMNTKYGKTRTLSTVEGGKVTLSCPFPESVTYPEWRGPTKLMLYTKMDDQSGEINSNAPAFERLQYASNKRDLILSNAVTSDSGDYTCSYTGQGNHTIVLKVNPGKGDQASNVVNAGSHRPGRPQPPPPSGANSNHSKLPDIHDRKGRGLSANLGDDDHPLVYINTPAQRADALESIPDSAKRKKKKRKKRVDTEDDQSD